MSQQPSKRQKLDSGRSARDDRIIRQVILEELDVEIGLRERLARILRGRLAWATSLKTALTTDGVGFGEVEFRSDAVETLEAIESECDLIFARPSKPMVAPRDAMRFVQHLDDQHSRSTRSRPPVVKSELPPAQLLFIRDDNASPATVAKMGLLNHCRLAHQRHFSNHDECMQACATVITSAEEKDWTVAHGAEISGISRPSVRRLFEIAVGRGDALRLLGHDVVQHRRQSGDAITPTLKTHLSQTLGHHEDSPALAPFLGRAPKRRCINVYDEDNDIDITGGINSDTRHEAAAWRMLYHHRSNVEEGDEPIDISTDWEVPLQEAVMLPATAGGVPRGGQSRFHMAARIIVADRSVWIPPDLRNPLHPHHTHRWMISVDSPSYSTHITSFLTRMTVTCLTDPPPSTLLEPISLDNPPFAIVSSTDRPFLAKVTLTWTEPRTLNPPLDIEHWVELDPFKSATAVLGEEQVLDVELDRNTELLPAKENKISRRWENTSMHQQPRARSRTAATEDDRQEHSLRDAYQRDRSSSVDDRERLIPLSTADVYRWLEDEGQFVRAAATAKRKMPGPNDGASTTPGATSIPAMSVQCCHICGLSHGISIASDVKQEAECSDTMRGEVKPKELLPKPAVACPLLPWHRTRMPILDVVRAMAPVLDFGDPPCNLHPNLLSVPPIEASSRCRDLLHPRGLVASADPQLTLAVQRIVSFPEAASRESADDHMGPPVVASWTRAEAEEYLAPFALMAHLVRPLIGELVGNAIRVARTDEEVLKATGQRIGGSPVTGQPRKTQMLTPSHVLRGLTHTRSAAFLAFSRLGIETQETDVTKDRFPNQDTGSGPGDRIKTEDA
ncbi:hypothetical protein PUNSTDRAFT_124482 [Punctularia strigosozonata HHB-11173 SS5]|uniref:uncharacterized protein n=1 Tax=Punctularia strigosozonata (strain HHB-11173) TaxID=741275 RepID=UPI000441722F|nr:uncharacterized protein PUNSTDRAFT_124482 [Punctularia strigosozonata HHB-11173 SS5]EIN12796.1 hypothetical protein PUNSTDRAFT_124482 [Punctularia strigosozonata HHB-11173 SS5]